MRTKSDEFRPSNEELNALREAGMTRVQIAVKYSSELGYQIPLSRVKRWLKELDVAPRANKLVVTKPKVRDRDKKMRYANFDSESLMDKAKVILGDRMTEKKHLGYVLDGRPVSSWQIAEAAGIKIKR